MNTFDVESPIHVAVTEVIKAYFSGEIKGDEGDLRKMVRGLQEALAQPNGLTIKQGPDPLYPTREAAILAPGDVYVHKDGGVYRRLGDFMYAGNGADDGKTCHLYEHLFPHKHGVYGRPADEFNSRVETDAGIVSRFTPAREMSAC